MTMDWPTAIVLIALIIGTASVLTSMIDVKRPIARHCVRCQKEIKEEAENNFTKHNIPGWEDDH